MSQIPPQYPQQPGMPPQQGGPVPYGGAYTMQPKASNGWGIASLITSLIGFCTFGVGGALGAIFGIVGIMKARKTKTGMGLSVAGLLLGLVSIGIAVVFSGAILAAIGMTQANRDLAGKFIKDLAAGNIAAAQAETDGSVKTAELEYVSKELKAMGAVTDVTSSSTNVVNSTAKLRGTITFGTSSQPFDMEQVKVGGAWKVSYFNFGSGSRNNDGASSTPANGSPNVTGAEKKTDPADKSGND